MTCNHHQRSVNPHRKSLGTRVRVHVETVLRGPGVAAVWPRSHNNTFYEYLLKSRVRSPPVLQATQITTHFTLASPTTGYLSDKTIYLPRITQVFQETRQLKDALKPLSEVSFACFPNRNTQQPSLNIFLIFQNTTTVETISKYLTGDTRILSPGEVSETPEILRSHGLKRHLPRLQPLANVPVLVHIVDKQVILRIGLSGTGKYHKYSR